MLPELKTRGKGRVDGAVIIETGEAGQGDAVDVGKIAADEQGAIGAAGRERFSQGEHIAVRAGARAEGAIDGAIVRSAGEMVAVDAVERGESAADDDAAIGLDEELVNGGVSAGTVVEEGRVEGRVGIEAGDVAQGGAIGRGEVAGGQDLAIGLKGDGEDIAIEAGSSREVGVGRTGRGVDGLGIGDTDDGGGWGNRGRRPAG